MSCLICK